MVSTKRAADDAGTQAPKKHKSDGAAASSNSGNPNGGMQPPKHRDAKKPGWNKGEKSWNKKVQNGVKEAIPHHENSREAHAAQRTLAHQRKLSKPLGDSILRSKKIWERLRIKSAVPHEERKELVAELFSIITGHVKDFVFKHDCVRVIQCALKYATKEQKKLIVEELKGSYRELAESRYGKFLVGKLVMIDNWARDVVVGEFVGGVKRMIRGPEAGWILDDVYRGAATPEQKALLLREWYGPEFVVFGGKDGEGAVAADLGKILENSPEKRGPIMSHLKEMINLLVQKKTTGFTMLHDAMLQYFLNTKVGSPEQTEILEMLKDDEEGDCVRNLAFTKNGSRLVCLALAYGNAKDRRNILKFFKTHVRLMAADANACHVLLTAYEVIDDTVMTAKAIFPELLGKEMTAGERDQELTGMVEHVVPRMALLYPLSPEPPKWLVTEEETNIVNEARLIRKETSKKEPEKRRKELVEAISQSLLDFIASQAVTLAQSSFGCQFMTEVLVGGIGEKQKALEALLDVVGEGSAVVDTPAFGRLLKTLVQGGRFDAATKKVAPVEAPLGFHDMLYKRVISEDKKAILGWASGANSWVILSMLEADDFSYAGVLKRFLSKQIDALEIENAGARKITEHIKRELDNGKPVEAEVAERPKKKSKAKKVNSAS